MKKCLCLSGQIRSWSLVKNNWLINFINLNPDIDVFCHFWHSFDNSEYVKNKGNGIIENQNLGKYGDYDFNDVIGFFKPKSFQIENPLDINTSNTHSMFNSIQRCNNIKNEYEINHNIKYDIVIRSRFDLIFNRPFIINDVVENTLYVKNRPGGCGGLNDWLAYGNSDVMNSYSNIINSIDEFNLVGDCAEGVIGNFADKNKLNIYYIDNVFTIMRNDGQMVS